MTKISKNQFLNSDLNKDKNQTQTTLILTNDVKTTSAQLKDSLYTIYDTPRNIKSLDVLILEPDDTHDAFLILSSIMANVSRIKIMNVIIILPTSDNKVDIKYLKLVKMVDMIIMSNCTMNENRFRNIRDDYYEGMEYELISGNLEIQYTNILSIDKVIEIVKSDYENIKSIRVVMLKENGEIGYELCDEMMVDDIGEIITDLSLIPKNTQPSLLKNKVLVPGAYVTYNNGEQKFIECIMR